jgi:hypothetical protein
MMLQSWIQNKTEIASQKRGLRRARNAYTNKGKEHYIEQVLYKEFKKGKEARKGS